MVESDARGRAGGGPIEPSIVRAGFTVVGVRTLPLDVVLGGVAAVVLIRTLLPKVVTRATVEGGSTVFPVLGASLLASERRDIGRAVLGGEKELDSRRTWPTLLGAGVAPAVPLTLIRRFICDGFVRSTHEMIMRKEIKTDQLELLLLRIQRDVESMQILTVPLTLLLHLCNVNLLVRAFRLQIADLFPKFLQLGLEGANALAQRVHSSICVVLSLNCGS